MTTAAPSQRFAMPDGIPDDWDVVQECQAEWLATEFARSWMIDKDATNTVLRLGFGGTNKEAARIARALYAHPLTQKKIKERMKDFQRELVIDEPTLLELLMAEAQYHGPGASPAARVNALKTVLQHLKDANNVEDDDSDNMPQVNIYLQQDSNE